MRRAHSEPESELVGRSGVAKQFAAALLIDEVAQHSSSKKTLQALPQVCGSSIATEQLN